MGELNWSYLDIVSRFCWIFKMFSLKGQARVQGQMQVNVQLFAKYRFPIIRSAIRVDALAAKEWVVEKHCAARCLLGLHPPHHSAFLGIGVIGPIEIVLIGWSKTFGHWCERRWADMNFDLKLDRKLPDKAGRILIHTQMVPLLLAECLLHKSFSNASPANIHHRRRDGSFTWICSREEIRRAETLDSVHLH